MSEYMLPSDEAKLEVLFSSMNKIDSILDDLNDAVFSYMPLCSDFEEQQRLDRLFVNSNGMDELLTLDRILRNAKDLALRTVHRLGQTTQAEVAY